MNACRSAGSNSSARSAAANTSRQNSALRASCWSIPPFSTGTTSLQSPEQPTFCLRPVAPNGAIGDAESLRGFLFGERGEEATLDHPAEPFIDGGERDERFVDGEQCFCLLLSHEQSVAQAHLP